MTDKLTIVHDRSLMPSGHPGTGITRFYPRSREVTGLFAVFNVVYETSPTARYKERMLPGSFARTASEDFEDLLFLWNHDRTILPTATLLDIQEVARDELPERVRDKYPEAGGGMFVTRRYLKNPQARWVYEALQAGVPLQMSYAMPPNGGQVGEMVSDSREGIVWDVQEVKLTEISDVPWGANIATRAALPGLYPRQKRILDGVAYRRLGVERAFLQTHSAGSNEQAEESNNQKESTK